MSGWLDDSSLACQLLRESGSRNIDMILTFKAGTTGIITVGAVFDQTQR